MEDSKDTQIPVVYGEGTITAEVRTVHGSTLTGEARIIGALCKRLGGNVELSIDELSAIQGVVLDGDYNVIDGKVQTKSVKVSAQ